jgi:cellulose synthase/poly-beta-1,6-N-acetylglucosamine synthase-like glycosyltransferase
MNTAPKLSVIIPHLNEPDGNLRHCLIALDAQRSETVSFEIIVVDNGSREMPTDDCAAIPGVRLVCELLPGPGPARNFGAALAKSDILAFIDADCTCQPGWAAAIILLMEQRPEIGLVGGDIGIQTATPGAMTAIEAYETLYSYRARMYVERYGFAATGNMAVRKKVFEDTGPFGGIHTMEDTEWGQRATTRGHRIAFLSDAKVLTPSCRSFPELARRWDRHIAHAYRAVGDGRLDKLRWLATSCLFAASPIVEAFRILSSNRLPQVSTRVAALLCLTRVRLYRARLMLELAFAKKSAPLVTDWNREKT